MDRIFAVSSLLAVVSLALVGCAGPAGAPPEASAAAADTVGAPRVVQYFRGTVTYSGMDGTAFGAPFPSLVRRVVDPGHGRVLEEVTQHGTTFMTIMKRQGSSLVFSAEDTAGAFHGTLTYEDETLDAWSYDIEVGGEHPGHLGGSLPDDGARFEEATGALVIRKVMGDQMRITERYEAIAEDAYEDAVSALVP